MGSEEGPGATQESYTEFLNALEATGMRVTKDRFETGAYLLQKKQEDAMVTIRIGLNDYSGADMVITNMTTLPDDMKGQGYGSTVEQELITAATAQGMKDIRAVQVQKLSQTFWEKNGFVKAPEPNNTNDFLYQGIL